MGRPYRYDISLQGNILPFNVLHKTLADTEVDNMPIPVDTTVLAQISAVLDDAEAFPKPERFDPNRFLNPDGKTFNATTVNHLVPFGLGKRQCAGKLKDIVNFFVSNENNKKLISQESLE